MATIREVSRLAGVSPSTVSRVINGTANVDIEKRERVLEAINQTNFQPNELARALYKKSSKIIGLIVPNIENPFFSELARTIEEAAFGYGFRLLLCNSNNDTEKERININMLDQMKADGVILITNSGETGKMIANCTLPVVIVDRHVPDTGEIAFIESDNYNGGRMATQCLVDCGCKKIVCMRGPQKFTSGFLRFKGYQDVCQENGIEERFIDCKYSFESGKKAALKMIETFPDTEGIFAANDMVALSAYKILRNHGIRVPENIQIVGFDDIGFSSLFSPEITTIHQPIQKMGQRAVDIIYQYSNGQPFEKESIFEVQLIKRETTCI
ncbi:MAG: LacI family DNA-binding transcriptional regulator [Kineothrix sp.]|nr:LacI family DNA-binding transcriptional regulator [Kineothrix sp.]